MIDSEIDTLVKKALFDVAPDLEGEPVEQNATFRDQFEIDSMDFLNFVIAVHEATGIDIPESDYAELQTLAGSVAYLKTRMP
ncbi:MAG: acyl carrier protein [Alphaproteobacteria bacterium]